MNGPGLSVAKKQPLYASGRFCDSFCSCQMTQSTGPTPNFFLPSSQVTTATYFLCPVSWKTKWTELSEVWKLHNRESYGLRE